MKLSGTVLFILSTTVVWNGFGEGEKQRSEKLKKMIQQITDHIKKGKKEDLIKAKRLAKNFVKMTESIE